jgi:hypothetical protein
VKTTQYIRIERAIAAASVSDIRERWLWGLRLLRDLDAFAPGSTQLKPGRADELVSAAKSAGLRLSEREIQYRLKVARSYPTEAQIAQAAAEFSHWTALVGAGFPAFEAPEGEPPADHRTEGERQRDHARAVTDILGDQAALFPLSDFEPVATPLKTLAEYADEMEEWTGRHVERDRKRRAYLEALIAAAGGDLSVSWKVAHDALGTGPTQPAPRPLPNPGPPPAPQRGHLPIGAPWQPGPDPNPQPPPRPGPPPPR